MPAIDAPAAGDTEDVIATVVDDPTLEGASATPEEATIPATAIGDPARTDQQPAPPARPPRDNVVRWAPPQVAGLGVRAATEGTDGTDGPAPVMFGHGAVFNVWSEIDSLWEGRFMEMLRPGAFKRTLANDAAKGPDNRFRIRCLLEHGYDPQVGSKPLGPFDRLEEDSTGLYYEVSLIDTSYNRDLLPALDAQLYGASFRFRVIREEWNEEPGTSDYNPLGLPERTIIEVELYELGPTTFPAYAEATADVRSAVGVRSLTGWWLAGLVRARSASLATDPAETARRLADEIGMPAGVVAGAAAAPNATTATAVRTNLPQPAGIMPQASTTAEAHAVHSTPDGHDALPEGGPGVSHAATDGTRSQPATESTAAPRGAPPIARGGTDTVANLAANATLEELRAREQEIISRFNEIQSGAGTNVLAADEQSEWNELDTELNGAEGVRARITVSAQRLEYIRRVADTTPAPDNRTMTVGAAAPQVQRDRGLPGNIYALEEYRAMHATDPVRMRQAFRDGAMRAAEQATFLGDRTRSMARLQHLLDSRDTEDGALAQRILRTGSPIYQRAFGKMLSTLSLTGLNSEEQRALSLGVDAQGGFAVPFQLDPTLIILDDGVINPLRRISRVETTVAKEWQGISAEGISVSRASENEEAPDSTGDGNLFDQPKVRTGRVQAFIPFSIELELGWNGLRTEVSRLLAIAKDNEEADSFVNGDGTNEGEGQPGGLLATLPSSSFVPSLGVGIASADLYAVEEDLGPRYRQRARWAGNKSIYNKVRQLDTSGGADLWVRLPDAQPAELIGYAAEELSSMPAAIVDGALVLVLGDFQYFLIVDRVGMQVELVPHLFGPNGRPTGQRGIYAYWFNSAKNLNPAAFRALHIGAVS